MKKRNWHILKGSLARISKRKKEIGWEDVRQRGGVMLQDGVSFQKEQPGSRMWHEVDMERPEKKV